MRALHEINPIVTANGKKNAAEMPNSYQASILERWFLPHQETHVVAAQQSKGVFLPWPLLAIIVTLAIVLVSGLITLEVQVSNLSTTLLLRDADHQREAKTTSDELATLKVYLQNDRERIIRLESERDVNNKPRR